MNGNAQALGLGGPSSNAMSHASHERRDPLQSSGHLRYELDVPGAVRRLFHLVHLQL